MFTRNTMSWMICVAIFGSLSTPALAGSHLWRIKEVFSNADGSVQFIEMKECCGYNAEVGLNNKWILSATTGSQFDFPANLSGGTAYKHLLLATQAFADLPGAPTPDYIIQENFFDTEADTLTYWLYAPPTFTYAGNDLPTNGLDSLVCLANNSYGCTTYATEVNSPTNFAGQSGSVNVGSPCPADFNGSGAVDAADLADLLAAWGPCADCPPDFDGDGDGDVDAADLAELLAAWGPCK